MREQYYYLDDCPGCGSKDAGEYSRFGGARKRNPIEWGHDYSCCSDNCGKAFLNSPNHIRLEQAKVNEAQARVDAMMPKKAQKQKQKRWGKGVKLRPRDFEAAV